MQRLRNLPGIRAIASFLTGCGGIALSSPSLTTSAASSGSQTFNTRDGSKSSTCRPE